MPTRPGTKRPMGHGTPILLSLVLAGATLACSLPPRGGFEPYHPANEQLRSTSQGLWQSQTLRPPAGLEQNMQEALRSIAEIEGGTDPRLAAQVSARLKEAWTELERSRAVGGLGYLEFDEGKFAAAEAAFRAVVTQFLGPRAPYPAERYQAALQALADTQALSREARRAVPGMASDDVLLTREKRQKLLSKEPKDEGMTPQTGIGTGTSR